MDSDRDIADSPWSRAPAWLLSLVMHLAAAILGALLIRVQPHVVDRDDGDRRAAIVLAQRTGQRTNYFSDDSQSSGQHAVHKPSAEAMSLEGGGSPAADRPPLIPGISLPQFSGGLPVGEGLVPALQPGIGRGRA